MKIAVEGCAHGELEIIYNTIGLLENRDGIKIDLLICCGDFQATRNEEDLHCMAMPPKYRNMCSFYKYYNGEKVAPILTIFIGGNHEASNYLQELPYGGWVAPNIYYLGYAGIINIAGVRIGGISGIYKTQDYLKGHFERPPYDESSKRSVYHIRNLEIFRLKQLSHPINIFMSHDWPTGVWDHGDVDELVKKKPHFKDDIDSGSLGGRPFADVLEHLQPDYWFAAHLHCKFAALIDHDASSRSTKFLALDKCLPRRKFLQVLDIPHAEEESIDVKYDLEWLTILFLTNHLLSVKKNFNYMPGPGSAIERWNFTPSEEEKSLVLSKFENNLIVPKNFEKSVDGYDGGTPRKKVAKPQCQQNRQTVLFCQKLSVSDPIELIEPLTCGNSSKASETHSCDDSGSIQSFSSPRIRLSLPQPKFEDNADEKTEEKIDENAGFVIDTYGANLNYNNSPEPVTANNSCNDKIRLTLPQPKFEDNSDKEVETNENISFVTDTSGANLNHSEEVSGCEISKRTESESISGPKKFKRRNASIYNSHDD